MLYIPLPRATESSPAGGREWAGLTRPGRSCHCAQLVLSHPGTYPGQGYLLCARVLDILNWVCGCVCVLRPTHWSCLAAHHHFFGLKRPSRPWLEPPVSNPQNGSQHNPLQAAAEMPKNAWHSGRRWVNWQLPLPACRLALTAKPRERREGKEQKELPNSDSLSLCLG